MKNVLKFAAILGVYVLIGGMGYYHLVILRDMRHPTADANTNTVTPATSSE